MSHPHSKSVSASDFFGQTKILISEWPGQTALLMDNGKSRPMKFKDAREALAWCEKHRATFYYLPTEPVAKN